MELEKLLMDIYGKEKCRAKIELNPSVLDHMGSNPIASTIDNNIFGWFGIHRRTLILVEYKCDKTQPKGKYIYYI